MKNARQLCRQVSKDKGYPEREVAEVYIFLMNRLKKFIINMEGSAITINGVGSYQVQIKKLHKVMAHSIKMIRRYRNLNWSHYSTAKREAIINNYIMMLRRQLVAHNEIATHNYKLKAYYAKKRETKLARLALKAGNAANGDKGAQPVEGDESLVDTPEGNPSS